LKGGRSGLASAQVPLALAWWAIGAATGSGREANAGGDLLRAPISAISWTSGFKFIADRTRPNGDARSFPSGHASSAFAAAWTGH
jgi:membrane-associated phospholipid phosphatase